MSSEEFMKSLTNYHDMSVSGNDLGWSKDYRIGHADGQIKGKQTSFERMKIGLHAYPYLWGPDYWNSGNMDGIGDNEGPRGEGNDRLFYRNNWRNWWPFSVFPDKRRVHKDLSGNNQNTGFLYPVFPLLKTLPEKQFIVLNTPQFYNDFGSVTPTLNDTVSEYEVIIWNDCILGHTAFLSTSGPLEIPGKVIQVQHGTNQ